MAKAKKLKKPEKHIGESYWVFFEVMHYLEQLHGKNFRDYAGKFGKNVTKGKDVPYLDFWHWICDQNDLSANGCWMHLPDWNYYMGEDAQIEPWKKEIMQYFYDFLGDEYHGRFWVEW